MGRSLGRLAATIAATAGPPPFARKDLSRLLAPYVVTAALGMLWALTEGGRTEISWPFLLIWGVVLAGTASLTLPIWDRVPVRLRTLPLFACLLATDALITRFGVAAPFLVLAILLMAFALSAAVLLPWHRLPRWAHTLPPMAFLACLLTIRLGTGEAAVLLFPIILLVILWLALHHSLIELAAGLAGAALILLAPVGTTPEPGLLMLGLAATLGLTVAAAAVRSRRAIADINEVVRVTREVAAGQPDDARRAICESVREVCGAESATLFELDLEGMLHPTAAAAEQVPDIRLALTGEAMSASGVPYGRGKQEYAAVVAFRTAKPCFHPRMVGLPQGLDELAREHGLGASVCVPVLHEGEPVGVLSLAWRSPMAELPARYEDLLTLFAAEAALVLRQADHARERLRYEEALAAMARVDHVTGIANRRAWEEDLDKAVARARRKDESLAVAIIDLDNFKAYNDEWGHQKGDRLLAEAARLWRSTLRDVDLIARYGGDEFAVILPECDEETARRTVQRTLAMTPERQAGSAGVAVWNGGETMPELIARADDALYQAKRNARGSVVLASPVGEAASSSAGYDIESILERRALVAVYQPIVRLVDGEVVGYEALARLPGMASEASVEELFAVANRLGYARDLDWLGRHAALGGRRGVVAQAPVFVNVGVWALTDPVHGVDQMLLLTEWAEISPRSVVLEISEREAINDTARLVEVMAAYRRAGFRFAIDDIGEGHSTLGVLAAANPEFIKLGKRILQGGPVGEALVRAICGFAGAIGAQVIAENLETREAVRQAMRLGVDLGQGFCLGRPVAPGSAGAAAYSPDL